MIAEHIIYSAALAILVGMVFYLSTGRDPSWILLVCAWAPDLDEIANPVLRRLGIRYFSMEVRSSSGHSTISHSWLFSASTWHFCSTRLA